MYVHTVNNGGCPEIFMNGVEKGIETGKTLLRRLALPRAGRPKAEPFAVRVPRLKPVVVHTKLYRMSRSILRKGLIS